MAKLADFLEKLASDDKFEKKYDKDPVQVMKDFGLDKEQRRLIRTGTVKEIRAELKKPSELGKDVLVFRVKRG
ncbi:MAG: hypothetical protein WB297_05935 [Actinomycetota bacterium]